MWNGNEIVNPCIEMHILFNITVEKSIFTWSECSKTFLLAYIQVSLSSKYITGKKWDKVLKNGPSKICGRQPLKNLKGYGLLKAFVPNVDQHTSAPVKIRNRYMKITLCPKYEKQNCLGIMAYITLKTT